MADNKKKKKDNGKPYEVNPVIDIDARALRTEALQQIDEILSRLGRLKLSRAMYRAAESGKLERARKRKESMAMTAGRAGKLGWRGARQQIKQGMAGPNRDYSTLDAATKTRIELIANRKKLKQQILAKKIKMARLRGESYDPLNRAFELMTEGKRYHKLMDKDGKVKFDARFKLFKNKAKTNVNEETVSQLFEQFYDNIESNSNAAKLALEFICTNEPNTPILEHAHAVAKSFGVSVKELMEE